MSSKVAWDYFQINSAWGTMETHPRVIWFSCSLWAQSREYMEKFMFCWINANKIFSLSCAADVCCCISDCFIHMFNSTAAPALREGGKQNNNKVSLKQTWWPSASWTFPKINEFFSWEAGTENRCSQRNALFSCFTCAHMKYFFLVEINALSVLEMMSQFEVKPKNIKV